MTWFDYSVLGILLLSVLLGWWRGMVYEVLSLAGWIAAYFVARTFAAEASRLVPSAVTSEVARSALAYAGLFIGVLFIGAVVAWLLSKLIKLAGLGMVDGMLGALFGLLRGLFIVLVLVWLGGLTELPRQPFWRDAMFSPSLQTLALFSKEVLPSGVAQKITY